MVHHHLPHRSQPLEDLGLRHLPEQQPADRDAQNGPGPEEPGGCRVEAEDQGRDRRGKSDEAEDAPDETLHHVRHG
jgi:hypothetical protein